MYATFAGPRAEVLTPLAPLAVGGTGRVDGRGRRRLPRAGRLERPPGDGGGGAAAPRQPLGGLVRRRPGLPARPAGAVFAFTMLSVARNRRALMTLATYLGLGLALAGTRLLSARVRGRPLPFDQPFDYLLAIPLVLTFVLVLGVRAAFAVPADLGANWIFRLAGPHEAAAHAPAAWLACAADRGGAGERRGARSSALAVGRRAWRCGSRRCTRRPARCWWCW